MKQSWRRMLVIEREGNGRITVYVWLKDYDYVANMEKQKMAIDFDHSILGSEGNKKRKLMKKYESVYACAG